MSSDNTAGCCQCWSMNCIMDTLLYHSNGCVSITVTMVCVPYSSIKRSAVCSVQTNICHSAILLKVTCTVTIRVKFTTSCKTQECQHFNTVIGDHFDHVTVVRKFFHLQCVAKKVSPKVVRHFLSNHLEFSREILHIYYLFLCT